MNLLTQLNLKAINAGASTGSEWWANSTKTTIESINPATAKPIAQIYAATQADYQHVITAAQQAWHTWRQVPAPKRGECIRQIADVLRRKKDLLGSLVALEMGKSKAEGDGEVQEMIDMADFAVGQARMLYGNTMQSERPQHRMYEQWHPYGVVGVLTAFNFPVAVWAWNAFIAAICGNTVVWKPSPKVPLCALAVQHICNDVMAANGYQGIFALFITADNALAQQFVADPKVPLISFTGSSNVGREVGAVVAKRFGRGILELSGNNAIIVDQTANLALAIPAIVFGAVGTAGQRCTSTRRLFIHTDLYDDVVAKIKNAYQQITIGDPLDANNIMGPLIDEVAVQAYIDAIAAINKQGGNIIVGGKRLSQPGYFVEPTLVEADNAWDIVQCETFAPILYLMRVSSVEQAITLQNNVCQGLASAIFSENLRHVELFLAATGSDCGIANVNIGTSGAEIGGAFGGEKATGGGREAGSTAWQAYMRRQTVTINWSETLPLAQGIKFF